MTIRPPVRVALVASSFLPRFGGVEEHVLHVARALRDAGTEVVVWTVDQGDDVPADVDGIRIRALPCPLPARSARSLVSFAWRAPVAAARWALALAQDRPDVLHVHCFGPNGPWATAVARLTGRRLVVTAHGETFMDAHRAFDDSVLLRAGLRRSLRDADAVTACSAYTLRDLEDRFGLVPGRGEVVFNGIDAAEPGEPVAFPARYVLAVGRMVRNKGFDLLLRAFAAATQSRALPDDVRLVLGGDGPERAALGRLAGDLGVAARVVFPGRLSRGQVVTAMAGAVALVVPSRVEAFGIVVLEGWRAGVPVVVTAHGGPVELVTHEESGLVVDPIDPVALAGALERVVADPSLAARLGAAGRERVDGFGWRGVAARYAALYAA